MSSTPLPAHEKVNTNGENNACEKIGADDQKAKLPSLTKMDSLDCGGEDDELAEAVVDEEENLFMTLEQEQVKEEADDSLRPHPELADTSAAPRLLQEALKKGEVKPDSTSDTEVESNTNGKAIKAGNGEAKDIFDPSSDKAHQNQHRLNQLDFLLSKASEYSNFIAKDLDELQANMEDQAKMALKKDEKQKRKDDEKAGGKGRKSKRQKQGTENLATAQVKDAEIRLGSKPIFIQPPNLAPGCILKDYQLEGVRWLASLYENGVSGILGDEMGLGKTIQCVALIAHLLMMGVSGPFIIVAPLATLPNWVREFEKWLPSHPVVRYHGVGPEREEMMKGPLNPKFRRNKDFPFIVTSYEVAIRDISKLAKLSEFTYLIVDEGHRLKNHRCLLINSLKKIKAANRLLLTGTPIQNTLDELWSLLNFVNPTIFDDLRVFQSWFGFRAIGQKTHDATSEEDILLEQQKNQTVSKLHEILRPFLLRRVKSDVLSSLPPKKEIVVYSGMSKLQAGYAELIDKNTLRDTLISQGIEDGRSLSQTNKMMNHRKNINHPFLFGEPIDPNTGAHLGSVHPQLLVRASGKFALLDRMLDRLFEDGHQVLIFSQMTRVLNVMEDYLNFRQWKYCRIDGNTKIDDRQSQMDSFNAELNGAADGSRNLESDRLFVFLLSTRAGGLGITLIGADTCIIFDSDWNPHADSQAMDRCHRIGQIHPVAVYRLLTVNSVDIDMMEKQVSKKKLERMTIAGGDFRKAGRRTTCDFDVHQLESLLKSDIDLNTKGGDVEDVKISDEEFDMIMDRKRLFVKGEDALKTEGKMYDIIEAESGDVLGAMNT